MQLSPALPPLRSPAASVGAQPDAPGDVYVPGQGLLERGGHHAHGKLGFHPDTSEGLTADYLASHMKRDDPHVLATIEGSAWSPLLSDEDRHKLLAGAIAKECVVTAVGGAAGAPLHGPEGYLAWMAAWRAAVPDLKSSVHMIASVDPAQASICCVPWTRSGKMDGGAALFGVASTGKHICVSGMTWAELRGAQVVRIKIFVELNEAVARAAVEAAAA